MSLISSKTLGLFNEIILAQARTIERYCEFFEERGLYRLEIQHDIEPWILSRTTLVTMFRKPLAVVDLYFDPKEQKFGIHGWINDPQDFCKKTGERCGYYVSLMCKCDECRNWHEHFIKDFNATLEAHRWNEKFGILKK